MEKPIEEFRNEYTEKHDLIGNDPNPAIERLNKLVDEIDDIRIKELENLTGKTSEVLYSFNLKGNLDNLLRQICIGVHLTSDTSLGMVLPLKKPSTYGKSKKDIKEAVKKYINGETEKINFLPHFFNFYTLEFAISDDLRSGELNKFLLNNYFFNGEVKLFGSRDGQELDGSLRNGKGFRIGGHCNIGDLEELAQERITEDFNSTAKLLKQTANKYIKAINDPNVLELFENYKDFEREVKKYNKQTSKIIRRIRETAHSILRISSDDYLGRFTEDAEKYSQRNDIFSILEDGKGEYSLKVAAEFAKKMNENAVRNIKGLTRSARRMELRRNNSFIEMTKTKEKIKDYFSEKN